jgi:hypothetical protein
MRCVETHLPPTEQADGVGCDTREFSSVERQKDESPRAKAARGAPGGIGKERSLASLGMAGQLNRRRLRV